MLYITKIEKPHQRMNWGYKYLITREWTSYSAFHTDKWFKEWKNRLRLKLKQISSSIDPILWIVKCFSCDIEIKDEYFRDLKILDNECIKYKWLSNWSLVDCYVKVDEKIIRVYRPNPNEKDVYKPLSLTDHIQYQRIHW